MEKSYLPKQMYMDPTMWKLGKEKQREREREADKWREWGLAEVIWHKLNVLC